MHTILKSLYHDDPTGEEVLCNLDEPRFEEERRIVTQLRAVDETTAEALKASIETLADTLAEQSYYNGVRFGAQLMAELLEED